MVLKLYGPPTALGATLAVVMTLHEKQIPFDFTPIDFRNNGHKAPEFLAIQPFGQVPAIDDDGFVLYESRAICRYLAEKFPDHGTSLIPTESKAKALFEQAASIEQANFHPYAYAIYVEGVQKARRGLDKDQAKYDEAASRLSATLQVYEQILGKQKYLAGDEFSLVDIFHLSFGGMLATAGCDLLTSSGPNVARWWNAMIGRQAFSSLKGGAMITSVASY